MPRPTRLQRFSRRSLLTLGSAAAGFWAIQAMLGATLELSPALRDPEFGQKLTRLQQQLAAHPERPLLLIVGSSRSSCGLQPAAMNCPSLEHGSQPLVFNLALTGYGPVQQLELLARLQRTGIRPRWILAEILPVLLHQEPGQWAQEWIPAERLDWRDLTVVGPYLSSRGDALWRWARSRLLPAWWFRFQLLNDLSPGWLDTRLRQDGAWCNLDDDGWLPLTALDKGESAAERRRRAREHYAPAFNNFCVTPTADGALRQFIEMAERDRSAVGFFLMPEGAEFQSWYPAGAREKIIAYLRQLSRDAQVQVLDATTWCAESDFADSHHLCCDAARLFSQRFGQEVVGPFLSKVTSPKTETAQARQWPSDAPR